MKKLYLSLVTFLLITGSYATNYYVDGINGSDALGSGLSSNSGYRTIAKAGNLTLPGDTVFIMNGTYSSFTIARPGNATGQIVYTNYPGHAPVLVSTNNTYNVITVTAGSNYITINGLEIIGWGVNLSLAADTIPAQAAIVCAPGATSTTNVTFIPKYNGNGINVGGSSAITHHVVISNNKIHDCAAVGIGIGYSDYTTIDGNTVYNNSWYTPYGTSGISFGNSLNYDNNTTTYRTIVKNNICYGNRLYVVWRGSCTISDGNGIIIDIPQPGYTGRQLVYNNICYNNGGSGIHTINNNHVDFLNNVAYLNSATPTNGGSAIYAYGCDDVRFYNNILVSRPGKTVDRCPSSTNVVYDYNIYSGGSSIDYVGAHSLIRDPGFVNPSIDPATADFHLKEGSFAVNNGDNSHSTLLDKDGIARPQGSVVDMGAYESSYNGNLATCNGLPQTKILGSGGGTGEPGAIFYGPYDSKAGTSNQKGRRAFIYPQPLLAASGVPATATLTSLQFRRALQVGSTQIVPDNSIVKIYLRNEAADNFGVSNLDWNTILPTAASPASLVYAGDASVLVGNAGGWKNVPLQIPFNYAGSHLGVYIEYLQKGNVSGGTDVQWIYDNGGSQPLYNTATYPNQLYGSKATGTTGTISDALATNSERRPVVTLGYCIGGPLPVNLFSFDVLAKNNYVSVEWSTATEANNKGFEVQRSANGSFFETVGQVGSKAINGSSTQSLTYHFNDVGPLKGKSYYRLAQQDIDGKIVYSSIVAVNFSGKPVSSLSIYPNPVHDVLNVVVGTAAISQQATISVQDVSGRTIGTRTQLLAAGSNTILIDAGKISPGAYVLVIHLANGEKLSQTFMKR